MKKLDCRGMECPKPVIMTKKEIENMSSGSITVLVDNEIAKENVSRFANSQGCGFEVAMNDGNYEITITKDGISTNAVVSQKETEEAIENVPNGNKSGSVVLIGSDKMGEGLDELGAVLMKGYLYTLTEISPLPSAVLFVNGGVKLTCKGSEALESIHGLEEAGVEIISCGTCLDYYDLKDKLDVGIVGNMYLIAETMNNSKNTIRI